MRNELAPVAKQLSELLDYKTEIKQSKHLFQKDLDQVLNAKKEAKKKVREESKKVSEEEARLLEAKFLQSFANNGEKQRWLKKNEEKGQQRAQKEKALKLRLEQRRLKKCQP